jgi:hypothetical protein
MSRLFDEGDDRKVCNVAEEKVASVAGTGAVLVKEVRLKAPPNTPIFRPEARVRLVALPMGPEGQSANVSLYYRQLYSR